MTDSGPLGLLTNPRDSEVSLRCRAWLRDRLTDGWDVMAQEIADYEVRRELLRAGKVRGIVRLDALGRQLGLVPSGGPVFIEAAALWAKARR